MEEVQKYSTDNRFLLSEMVKRDFKKRYHHSVLGVCWSVMNPFLTYLIMRLVFTYFFGRNIPHYSTYLFSGVILFSYFSQVTNSGMTIYISNRRYIERVNLPPYLYLLSKNLAMFIDFLMTFVAFLIMAAIDGIRFGPHMLALLFPMLCMAILCYGAGHILAVVYIYFRDFGHIYSLILVFLRYGSAIFYDISSLPASYQRIFYLNPLYLNIRYFRGVVIEETIPSLSYHLLMAGISVFVLIIGIMVYKHNRYKLVYNF